MAGKLEGKIALVTGGSSGIGLATAQSFIHEGAFVYITGRRQSELDKAVKAIGVTQLKAVRADASSLSDLDRLFEQIKREKGRLDIVFANAGGGSFAPIGLITDELYQQTFDTNVKGVLFTVQKALPLVKPGPLTEAHKHFGKGATKRLAGFDGFHGVGLCIYESPWLRGGPSTVRGPLARVIPTAACRGACPCTARTCRACTRPTALP